MHWYVYYSRETMGHAYENLPGPVVHSSKLQPKLCLGDTVWVVEGDESTPVNYTLVDKLVVDSTDTPSPVGPYARFKLKVSGGKSLIAGAIPLTSDMHWFSSLHSRYITKQRFFASLGVEPEIERGLRDVAA